MTKVVGMVLAGLGTFLLVTAFLASVWAPGVVKKTPEKVDSDTYLTGDAQKLNLQTMQQEQLPVKIYSQTLSDSKKTTDTTEVFVNNVCVVVNEDNAPDCVKADDDRLIQASTSIFAADRVTGEAVDMKSLHGLKDYETREGLVNKFPFDAEKKTYPYWDGTLGAPSDAVFDGEDEIDGLKVYKYVMTIDNETIDIAEGIKGTYSLDKTMWVEPLTGSIIDQEQHDVRKLEDGTNVLDMSVSFTDDTVKVGVKDGKANSDSLKLLTDQVPMFGYIGGAVLLVVGLAMALFGGRRKESA